MQRRLTTQITCDTASTAFSVKKLTKTILVNIHKEQISMGCAT